MDEKEKIIDALKTIKKVCDEVGDTHCNRCPLCDYTGDCGITNLQPCNWKINEPGEVWRALL